MSDVAPPFLDASDARRRRGGLHHRRSGMEEKTGTKENIVWLRFLALVYFLSPALGREAEGRRKEDVAGEAEAERKPR